MANIDKAFDIELLSLKESVLVVTGTDDPRTGAGFEAPVGSLYLRSNGELYTKTGTSDTGWSQVETGTYSPVNRVQKYYVGKHGNDSNTGLVPDFPFLTFSAAIAAATSQTPSSINRFEIVCEDAGIYNENLTIPSWVAINAPGAVINGSVTLNDNCELTIGEVSNSIGNTIQRLSGTGTSRVIANTLIATGNGNTIYNSSGILIVEAEQVYVENGSAFLDESSSSGHIHIDVEDIYITGSGSAIDKQSNTGFIVGYVSHILEIDGGIGQGTAIDVNTGRVDLISGKIATTTAYKVSGAGTLQIVCTNITGSRIQLSGNAVVDVLEARTHRWQNVSSPTYYPNRFEFLNVDTQANPITIYLPTPPSNGDAIQLQDAANNFGTNNLTIDGNGSTINGQSSIVLDSNGASLVLIYSSARGEWTYARTDTTAFSPSNIVYVTKNGSDVSGDGSFSNPYLTVKKGVQEASLLANSNNPVTVKILDGIYDEVNPIIISNEYVNVLGEEPQGVIIRPTVNGQPLFQITSGTSTLGATAGRITVRGKVNGGIPYGTVSGGSLFRISGDGEFSFDDVNVVGGYVGVDYGNGTISTRQRVIWNGGNIEQNQTGVDGKGSNSRFVCDGTSFIDNTISINATGNTGCEINNFHIGGPNPTISGVGIQATNNSYVLLNGGLIDYLATGIQASATSSVRAFSVELRNNTTDINQTSSTATIAIQGSLSKSKQLITNGSNVSLTYTNTDTGDYIIGSMESTGTPGKEFRVRDFDGRIAIGDNATDANIAAGGIGASRSLNLIDTNGNIRIWRFVSADGQDPALEWIKGINPANTDSVGDAPITAIQAATNTIIIDVASVDYGDPLTQGGIDRTTLAERAFPPGRSIRVNGTVANNGDYTVSSATYNPINQTISIVVAENITTNQGAGGTVVFGGGAGRPDGVSTFVGDPGAAVSAGAGNVWWDMFLQEDDYFVIRRRTGGGGGTLNEKVRVFSDHSEWLGSTTYNNSDNAQIIRLQTVAGAVNSLQILNAVTGSGPNIQAVGTDTNVNILLTPKGTGTVRVPLTYDPTAPNDLITRQYADVTYASQTEINNIELAVGLNDDGTFNPNAYLGASVITNPTSVPNAILQLDAAIGDSVFSRHNGNITQTFNTTPTTILFGTNIRTDADYTYNTGIVTINSPGTYDVSFEVSYATTTNGVTTCETSIYLNGSQVPGSIAYSYHSTTTSGRQTTTCTIPISCNVGDTLQVVGVRVAGGGSLTTQAQSCRLNIRKLR